MGLGKPREQHLDKELDRILMEVQKEDHAYLRDKIYDMFKKKRPLATNLRVHKLRISEMCSWFIEEYGIIEAERRLTKHYKK